MTQAETLEQYDPIWMDGRVPNGFWDDKKNQKRAMKWLIKKEKKLPVYRDFPKNSLRGLVDIGFGKSSYDALLSLSRSDWRELEPIIKEENVYKRLREAPWAVMESVPDGYWNEGEHIREAIKWLVRKKGGLPKAPDYYAYGLSYPLVHKFGSSHRKALAALGESDWKQLERELPGIIREKGAYEGQKRMQGIVAAVLEFLDGACIETTQDLKRYSWKRLNVGDSGGTIYVEPGSYSGRKISKISYAGKGGFPLLEAKIAHRDYLEVVVNGDFHISRYKHIPIYGGRNTRVLPAKISKLKRELSRLKSPRVYTPWTVLNG